MKKLVRTIAIGVVAGVAVWLGGHYGWRWWNEGRFLETTDNAYVRSDVTLVAPKIGGYVVSVDVEDNQPDRTWTGAVPDRGQRLPRARRTGAGRGRRATGGFGRGQERSCNSSVR